MLLALGPWAVDGAWLCACSVASPRQRLRLEGMEGGRDGETERGRIDVCTKALVQVRIGAKFSCTRDSGKWKVER